MSRPKDLPTALQSWANTTYTPAGKAWDSTAQRSTPAGSALVPGVSLPAEVANYLHGNAFDGAQGAINAVGQLSALNWQAAGSLGNISVGSFAWSDLDQAWWAVLPSASNAAQQSFDFGKTWSTITTLAASIGNNDIAFDTSGNFVTATASGNTNVQSGTRTAFSTYTTVNTAAVIPANVANVVVYEPLSALWCILGGGGVSTITGVTSANRTTWTARTLPAAWTTVTAGTGTPQIGVGGGVIVAAFVDTTSTFRTMRSATGGVSWTNDQQLTPAGITLVPTATTAVGGGISKPVWSAVDSLWYITAFQTSTRKTQVYSSPDAITWTNCASLTANDVALVGTAPLGTLLVGLNNDGRVFTSWTRGTTWFRVGSLPNMSSPVYGLRAGGNGVLAMGGNGATAILAYGSARFGLPVTAA